MNTSELLQFIPKAGQADFLKYCMITAALAKHYLYNDYVCWNLSEAHILKYNRILNNLKEIYCNDRNLDN